MRKPVFLGFRPGKTETSQCSSIVRPARDLELKIYRKVPKFWEARNLCCSLPKIQTKTPNPKVFCQKHANGIANSEDPDQTAPLGAV